MEKLTVDQLLKQMTSGQNPGLSQAIEDLVSAEPGGAEALTAYRKEPEKNRGLLEEVLGRVLKSSDNPILKLILAALQGGAGKQEEKETEHGGLLGEVLETLADNLLDKPKPKRKTRPKSKSKPKTGASTKSKAKSGTKSKPKTGASTQSKTKGGTKSKPKTGSSTKAKPKTGTKPKTTSSKSKPKTPAKTQTKSPQIELEE